jgi:hypothetical protein
MVYLSSAMGYQFAEAGERIAEVVRSLGPSPLRHKAGDALLQADAEAHDPDNGARAF